MAYTPRPVPQIKGEAGELALWVAEELRNVARTFQESEQVQHTVLSVEPPRPRKGMVVYADGVNWDPGDGEGQYVYDGTAWVLSSTGLTDTSNFLTKSGNLSDVANVATTQDNLNLQPGVDVMAYDPQLSSLIRQNTQNGNYTLVLTDGGKHLYYGSGAGPYTWTIPANASVAFPIGTTISFVNLAGGPTIAIAITSDTLYWSKIGGGSGTRTLANYGVATAIKFNSTGWIISGTGLT